MEGKGVQAGLASGPGLKYGPEHSRLWAAQPDLETARPLLHRPEGLYAPGGDIFFCCNCLKQK